MVLNNLFLILSKWLNSSIWAINETLTVNTILGHSGPGSNGQKELLHNAQNSRSGSSSLR